MKNIILLIAVMVLSACASMPTAKSMVGTYEFDTQGRDAIGEGQIQKHIMKVVLLENGIVESYKNLEIYTNGKKDREEKTDLRTAKWAIVNGEIHATDPNGNITVIRINKDGSLTPIAGILKDGRRNDILKEYQTTYKKIK